MAPECMCIDIFKESASPSGERTKKYAQYHSSIHITLSFIYIYLSIAMEMIGNMDIAYVSGLRRNTFHFDKVLYSDENVAVTPAVIIVRKFGFRTWGWLMEREYAIQHIGRIFLEEKVRFKGAKTYSWMPSWYNNRKNGTNLTIEIYTANGWMDLCINVKQPAAVSLAVDKAKSMFYY